MLVAPKDDPLSEVDQTIFAKLVPFDHPLRQAETVIDFALLREQVAAYYSPDLGRPSLEPLLMLKLTSLQYMYRLSDRQVIDRAGTDIAFRWFLCLGLDDHLPDSSSLSYFRSRLGTEGFQAVFHEIVAQAREHGLIKDRLRVKDATHVIADVAIPATLQLVAQTRNRLLAAAEAFAADRVTGERSRIEMIRQAAGAAKDEQLEARITHLREILEWVEALPVPADAEGHPAWQKLQQACRVAHKVLCDQDDPSAGDRLRSVVDPDARRGKHGAYYDGYLLDVMIDADSEIVTAVDVLPANGQEAANAARLIQQEQEAQGNQIEQFSIDGIGMNGPVLRELQDPEGLNVEVFVPPGPEPENKRFGPEAFDGDSQAEAVTCPAGQTSTARSRDDERHRTLFKFADKTCADCPLKSQCLNNENQQAGRKVIKNDYEAEYRAARAKAATPEYKAVRREHPKVERKLSELVNRHGSRRARSRGQPRVLIQQLLATSVANIKRIVTLLGSPVCAAAQP